MVGARAFGGVLADKGSASRSLADAFKIFFSKQRRPSKPTMAHTPHSSLLRTRG